MHVTALLAGVGCAVGVDAGALELVRRLRVKVRQILRGQKSFDLLAIGEAKNCAGLGLNRTPDVLSRHVTVWLDHDLQGPNGAALVETHR